MLELAAKRSGVVVGRGPLSLTDFIVLMDWFGPLRSMQARVPSCCFIAVIAVLRLGSWCLM